MSSGATWRPPQWQTTSASKVLITFPGQGNAPQYSGTAGSNATLPATQTLYAFDAELEIEHQQELRRTEHPVQTGTSISDHAYIVPARLVLDVGMSDAMDAYYNPTTWSGSTSKSVSAYQTMLALQFSRIPLSITTRLRTYQNMVIEALTPQESAKTITGLRMRVEFGQIFMADVSMPAVSARSQDTDTTNLGSLTTQPPSASQTQQNEVPSTYVPWNAVGAGNWSSDAVSNSNGLPSK